MSENINFLFLFMNSHAARPVITLLQRNISEYTNQLKLTCTSTTSPPTTVVWSKDGRTLTTDEGFYTFSQVLIERRWSTYNNILSMSLAVDPDTVAGTYTCRVGNIFGYAYSSLEIQGDL